MQILAGLLDQYKYADNAHALKMATGMVEYFYNRVQKVIRKYSVGRHWQYLNEEPGGMNDVLYRLFSITVGNLIGFRNLHYLNGGILIQIINKFSYLRSLSAYLNLAH